MKAPAPTCFSDRYQAALRNHVGQISEPGELASARELGAEALACKLETLDLARIHDHAMKTLVPLRSTTTKRRQLLASASTFFNEVLSPIEAGADLIRLHADLAQRTLDLADSQLKLQNHVTDRKATEAALESSLKTSAQMLAQSRLLEKKLRGMAREILDANEVQRKRMSLHLHDEIAQTLLAINVRLLALEKDAATSTAGLSKGISATQRLLLQSVKTINRFAREFGIPHET